MNKKTSLNSNKSKSIMISTINHLILILNSPLTQLGIPKISTALNGIWKTNCPRATKWSKETDWHSCKIGTIWGRKMKNLSSSTARRRWANNRHSTSSKSLNWALTRMLGRTRASKSKMTPKRLNWMKLTISPSLRRKGRR